MALHVCRRSDACRDIDEVELCAETLLRSHGPTAAALLVHASRHVPGQRPTPVLPLRHPSDERLAAVLEVSCPRVAAPDPS